MKYIKQFESFNSVNEVFGLSKKEKALKELKNDIEKAKKEISSFTVSNIFKETENFSKEHKEKLLKIIYSKIKSDLPTVAKLLPSLFKTATGAVDATYKHGDVKLKGLIPSKWSFAMNSLNDTSITKENVSKYLNAELDKLK